METAANIVLTVVFALVILMVVFFLETLRPTRRVPALGVIILIIGGLFALASVLLSGG